MMNLADPELELVDPTPNVHALFIHFDKEFFSTKLASRAVVRWSKRMYSCAGICSKFKRCCTAVMNPPSELVNMTFILLRMNLSKMKVMYNDLVAPGEVVIDGTPLDVVKEYIYLGYEGRAGLCDIALSEPLLKLRPRKDLVETLLHEMIHAFLFVTNRDQDRDGHGPNFQFHMHRINKRAGLKISIYHSFHDEVHLYQTHWWRCNGPCTKRKPHFGIVRRPTNRAPGPSDYWWNDHKRKCGGTFTKIKEPENFQAKQKSNGKSTAKKNSGNKINSDITKYISNNNNKTINSVSNTTGKPVLKNSNTNLKTKSGGSNFNPSPPKPKIPLFTGNGHTINETKHISDHRSVTEYVRRIWAAKEVPSVVNKGSIKKPETSMSVQKPGKISITSNNNKQKSSNTNIAEPPAKMKKIDDYFKATSMLKEIYGEDFRLTQKKNNTKLVAIREHVNVELVDCPTCNTKIDTNKINEHLDECLNRDIIKELSQVNELAQPSVNNLVQIVGSIPVVPAFKGNVESTTEKVIDLTILNNTSTVENNISRKKDRRKSDSQTILQVTEQHKAIKKIYDKTSRILDLEKPDFNKIRKSDNFISKNNGGVNTESSSRISSDPKVKIESSINEVEPIPGPSKDSEKFEQICPCCGKQIAKPVDEHLDECLVFSDNNCNISEGNATTSISNQTTVVLDDDDDILDESQEFNETGTKTPCPCCMKMVEEIAMNDHLDLCLGISNFD